MPAMLDDPTAPAVYRISGAPPYPTPSGPLPPEIACRQVTLRDRVTIATLIPFSSPHQVPHRLTAFLFELLNREIEKGDTYPMMEAMPLSSFGPYWFANFGAVMVLGDLQSVAEVAQMEDQGVDWAKMCLGSFYVKPNYPGRSSHVCNGGFLVTDSARNRGVGRLMGECYIDWAPKLGYTYSVFNLVYETNVASLRIWDALGFKRIGRVKGCGNLKSYPDQYIDAIIFGRELGGEGDEYITEERFDKIRFYLKTGTYPNGSDRAEKSRLRSAATHYRLIPNPTGDGSGEDDRLMLKGKEVVSDPHKQYEIARNMHNQSHGGINKTTASIAEKYHWVRIKETVSAAIRNCSECKDSAPQGVGNGKKSKDRETSTPQGQGQGRSTRSSAAVVVAGADPEPEVSPPMMQISSSSGRSAPPPPGDWKQHQTLAQALAGAAVQQQQQHEHRQLQHENSYPQHHPQIHEEAAPMAQMASSSYHHHHHHADETAGATDYGDMPVDPRIMEWQDHSHSHAQIHDAQAVVDGMAVEHHHMHLDGTQAGAIDGEEDHEDERMIMQRRLEFEDHILGESSQGGGGGYTMGGGRGR